MQGEFVEFTLSLLPHNTKIHSFGTDSEWLLYEAIKSSESGLGGYAAVRREGDEC